MNASSPLPGSALPGPNEPRRVAIALLRYFPHGGLQRIARDTAEALALRGHRVTLYTQDWQGPMPDEHVRGPGTFDAEVLAVRGHSNHARARRFGARLSKQLEAHPVDVVLGFDRLPGLDLYFAGDPCYAARIRRERGLLHRWTPRSRTFQQLERAVFGTDSGTRILLMNGSEEVIIRDHYGTPHERFAVLPPGYSGTRRRGQDASLLRARTRASLGIASGPTPCWLLLALGSDFHRKGFDRALRATRRAAAALPDQRFVLAIAGADRRGKLEALARELGISASVLWLGARDDVPALLQAADLLIHPCRSEPAGMVLLEALSAGTPVITSACAGYACHVEASGAGAVLPEPFQQSALDEALIRLVRSPMDPLQDLALAHMASLDPGAMIEAVVGEVERA